jgi:uncharacterized repeat protein (TIGR03803 family)
VKVLYNFSGGVDGALPYAGVILDQAGNLYGTTTSGGTAQAGTVFKLSPGSPHWTENVLYSFVAGNDGQTPEGGLVFDSAGNLYGTTAAGGPDQAGTVYEITP